MELYACCALSLSTKIWWAVIWTGLYFSAVLCRSVMSDSATPRTVAHQAPLSMGSPGKDTGVGCHSLLQGIFLTLGSNPGLPHCRWLLYHLSHQGSPQSESVSHSFVSDSAALWTVAHQPILSMEFSRQEYWSGLPFPSSGDLPNWGIEPRCPALQADSLPSEPLGKFSTSVEYLYVICKVSF